MDINNTQTPGNSAYQTQTGRPLLGLPTRSLTVQHESLSQPTGPGIITSGIHPTVHVARTMPEKLEDLPGLRQKYLLSSSNPAAQTFGLLLSGIHIELENRDMSPEAHMTHCIEIRESAEMLNDSLDLEPATLQNQGLQDYTPEDNGLTSDEYVAINDDLALQLHAWRGIAATRQRAVEAEAAIAGAAVTPSLTNRGGVDRQLFTQPQLQIQPSYREHQPSYREHQASYREHQARPLREMMMRLGRETDLELTYRSQDSFALYTENIVSNAQSVAAPSEIGNPRPATNTGGTNRQLVAWQYSDNSSQDGFILYRENIVSIAQNVVDPSETGNLRPATNTGGTNRQLVARQYGAATDHAQMEMFNRFKAWMRSNGYDFATLDGRSAQRRIDEFGQSINLHTLPSVERRSFRDFSQSLSRFLPGDVQPAIASDSRRTRSILASVGEATNSSRPISNVRNQQRALDQFQQWLSSSRNNVDVADVVDRPIPSNLIDEYVTRVYRADNRQNTQEAIQAALERLNRASDADRRTGNGES